jgi:hypothetical protein
MEKNEEEVVYLIAKFLSDKGEIVKINSDGRRIIKTTENKEFVPDLLTLDKTGNVKGIYEIMLKLDESKLLKLKDINESIEVNLIVSEDKKKELNALIKKIDLKVKSVFYFVKKD